MCEILIVSAVKDVNKLLQFVGDLPYCGFAQIPWVIASPPNENSWQYCIVLYRNF